MQRTNYALVSACLVPVVILLTGLPAVGEDCHDTVTIGDQQYPVPERWCGSRLDSTESADKTRLVSLPDAMTYQDYRIYVLPQTQAALAAMAEAARKDSIILIVDSGYRSSAYQEKIITRRLAAGETPDKVLSFVAPPGYSEHETGRAVDFVPSDATFAETQAYQWLKANASEFGFHESYPESTADSIPWESSHWLYIPTAPAE